MFLRKCSACKQQCFDPDVSPEDWSAQDLEDYCYTAKAIYGSPDDWAPPRWYCEPCWEDLEDPTAHEGGGSIRA